MNEKIEVVLSDGFKFKAVLNGNTLIPESKVDDKELTDTNLVSVTIDGQKHENMTCVSNTDTALCLRQYTETELNNQKLDAKIQYIAMMGGITL